MREGGPEERRAEEARTSALIQCAHRDVVFSTLASTYLFVFGDVCDEDEVHVHAVDRKNTAETHILRIQARLRWPLRVVSHKWPKARRIWRHMLD